LDVKGLLIVAPVLLFSVIAHEIAHGYAALKQGDETARAMGRLSWNPVRHIDPWMTIIVPLILFVSHLPVLGGAKPVPVNPRNYRNIRRGDIIVSLAGVATNLLIAIACVVLFPLLGMLGRAVPALESTAAFLQAMAFVGLLLNLVLIGFNLIPIPPLDGSHVFKYLLPLPLAIRYQQVSRYGILVLLGLMWFWPRSLQTVMSPAYGTFSWATSRLQGYALPSIRDWVR
jgi:Zn-dependent protease